MAMQIFIIIKNPTLCSMHHTGSFAVSKPQDGITPFSMEKPKISF